MRFGIVGRMRQVVEFVDRYTGRGNLTANVGRPIVTNVASRGLFQITILFLLSLLYRQSGYTNCRFSVTYHMHVALMLRA